MSKSAASDDGEAGLATGLTLKIQQPFSSSAQHQPHVVISLSGFRLSTSELTTPMAA